MWIADKVEQYVFNLKPIFFWHGSKKPHLTPEFLELCHHKGRRFWAIIPIIPGHGPCWLRLMGVKSPISLGRPQGVLQSFCPWNSPVSIFFCFTSGSARKCGIISLHWQIALTNGCTGKNGEFAGNVWKGALKVGEPVMVMSEISTLLYSLSYAWL